MNFQQIWRRITKKPVLPAEIELSEIQKPVELPPLAVTILQDSLHVFLPYAKNYPEIYELLQQGLSHGNKLQFLPQSFAYAQALQWRARNGHLKPAEAFCSHLQNAIALAGIHTTNNPFWTALHESKDSVEKLTKIIAELKAKINLLPAKHPVVLGLQQLIKKLALIQEKSIKAISNTNNQLLQNNVELLQNIATEFTTKKREFLKRYTDILSKLEQEITEKRQRLINCRNKLFSKKNSVQAKDYESLQQEVRTAEEALQIAESQQDNLQKEIKTAGQELGLTVSFSNNQIQIDADDFFTHALTKQALVLPKKEQQLMIDHEQLATDAASSWLILEAVIKDCGNKLQAAEQQFMVGLQELGERYKHKCDPTFFTRLFFENVTPAEYLWVIRGEEQVDPEFIQEVRHFFKALQVT